MLKLALRNILSKPFRAAATVLAVAVSVAMIFAMLSFGGAVYEYIYSTETCVSGNSDIVIATNSSSDRITQVTEPLKNASGVEFVCPSLTLYALLDGEYVQIRGFDKGESQLLQKFDILRGDADELDVNSDNIVISADAAERFGLDVGARIELKLDRQTAYFYVCAVADKSGYFLGDAPFLFVGRIEGISHLLANVTTRRICNEIYVKAADGTDIDGLVKAISEMDGYSSMLVRRSGDGGYIKEQANSLSAPVVLAGAAVFMLGIAVIVLLFMMSEKEKISLISKYAVIGATRKQIAAIFIAESATLALLGSLIGCGLAVGVFVGILKATLSPSIAFGISAWRLIVAALVGFISAVGSSLLPILRSFRGTIRQNQIDAGKRTRVLKILFPLFAALTVISVIVEFTVSSATAAVSVVSLALTFATLGTGLPCALKASAKPVGKVASPAVRTACVNIVRDGRFARFAAILGVGMTVAMLLFMAWSMTTGIFTDYLADFENMVFVTNVQSTVDTSDFETVNGVEFATKIVWKQGELANGDFNKTMNILGSKNALNLVDFEFITPKEEVLPSLSEDKPYIFVDIALKELYGVDKGDTLVLTIDGKSRELTVGGLLKHRLFSGNYIVMSEKVIRDSFAVGADTVAVTVHGDVAGAVSALREKFADKNYYVVDVLTAYKWDMQSTNAVFDLIGTLAVVVTLFIFAVTVAATLIGRGSARRQRNALLNAGMSKRALLRSEIFEHSLIAALSFVISFAASALLTACLIHALRLFGLYFEFMYEAWVAAVVGLAMGGAYALMPVALNYKKGYTIKKA